MFNPWIYLIKDPMLQSLIIISAFIFGFQTAEANDKKYFLSTIESPKYVTNLEEAQTKCNDSWLLEIYDENVVATLKNLNLNIQQNGILLGMKRDTNSWRWSDGNMFSGNIIDQTETTRVVACITNTNNNVEFVAETIFDSASVICSKVSTKDNCAEWLHYGLCYFKLTTTTTCNWFEAHNECIKNGASMAMFNNSETSFNMSFIDNQKYWVSLSRATWMWTHSDKAVTFNKWASGQPDINDKNCATINSDGSEWTPVNCSGTYHIVCMREINQENDGRTQQPTNSAITFVTPTMYEPTTQSLLPKPGGSSNFSHHANADTLSSGAKTGIGVGVSLLLIIITIIVGVLVFKYSRRFKLKSQSEIMSQDIYEKPDFNTCQNHIYEGLETK